MDARTITEVRQQMTELQISLNQLQTTFKSSNQVLAERVVELDRQLSAAKTKNESLTKHIKNIFDCYQNSSGYEPSLSVFHRALDEAYESLTD